MQKTAFMIASAILISSAPAQADFIGIYASADYWNTAGSSKIAQNNTAQQNFDHDDQGVASLSVSVEHPVPLIPNARVRYVQLKQDNSTSSNVFVFQNQTFAGNTQLETDLTNTDLLAYYEILDTVVSVDIGLGAKLLNGDFSVRSNLVPSISRTIKVKETLPVAYASVGGSLPFTGFSVKAEAVIGQNQDVSTSDLQAEVKYDFIDNLAIDMGAKLGYRMLKIDMENVKNTDAKLDFNGPYLGLELHF